MQVFRRILTGRALPWFLFVAAAATAVVFAVSLEREQSLRETEAALQRDLQSTARRFVGALTTFSSDTIEQDVEEIRSFATGRFEDEVDELFSDQTVEAIKSAGAASTSEVEAVFVQQLGDGEADVFAVASVRIENEQSETPRDDIVRMEIRFVRDGGAWKVSSVELFQSPGAPPVAPVG
ncbi:MAG TPA: hypothetical protein VM573_05325 [Actinomycetota bacterium]|jgi:hypothetical protein|nr:hypothetical protein [Actinomycetota bacterium]